MSGEYKVEWLCEAFLVSSSGYYTWQKRCQNPGPRAKANAQLKLRIREEYERSNETYGSPRITRALGPGIGRHRVARLMREEQIHVRQRSKFRKATTDSSHKDPIAPNRLREVKITGRDQAWATDATAVLTAQGWLYVVAFIDLWSRRIVGWAMHDHLDAALVTKALLMALGQRKPPSGLLVHSDRGAQYASARYRDTLAAHGCVASMSRKANCYDNAYIESFWSSLKYEVVYPRRFQTKADARMEIFKYIETFYNRRRLHSSLGYLNPVQFESQNS